MSRLPDLESSPLQQCLPNTADRTLRQATVCLFLPALGFLLAHGITAKQVCPALGLAPLFLSALTGLVHLFLPAATRKFPRIAIATDLFLAAFQLGVLIPSWVLLSNLRWVRASAIIVGTYGTVFLMADFAIHSILVVRVLRVVDWPSVLSRLWSCPHCGGAPLGRYAAIRLEDDTEPHQTIGVVDNTVATDKPASPPMEEYRDAQPGSDDETARLL